MPALCIYRVEKIIVFLRLQLRFKAVSNTPFCIGRGLAIVVAVDQIFSSGSKIALRAQQTWSRCQTSRRGISRRAPAFLLVGDNLCRAAIYVVETIGSNVDSRSCPGTSSVLGGGI